MWEVVSQILTDFGILATIAIIEGALLWVLLKAYKKQIKANVNLYERMLDMSGNHKEEFGRLVHDTNRAVELLIRRNNES